MACLKLPTVQLPTFGPIGLPTFSLPAFGGGAGFCCQINLAAYITLPPLPPIPIVGSALAIINAEIGILNAILRQLDLIAFSCPLDDGPISLTAHN